MCCRQQREKVKEELLNKKRRIICVKLRFSLFCQSQCFGLTHWCPSNLMEAEARRGPLYAINLPQLTIISSIVHSQISGNIVFLIIIIHTWVFKATLKLHKRNQSEKKKEADTSDSTILCMRTQRWKAAGLWRICIQNLWWITTRVTLQQVIIYLNNYYAHMQQRGEKVHLCSFHRSDGGQSRAVYTNHIHFIDLSTTNGKTYRK